MSRRIGRALSALRLALLGGLAAGFMVFGGAAAWAQDVRVVCERELAACVEECRCAAGDLTCLIRCPKYAPCLNAFNQCQEAGGEVGGGTLSVPSTRGERLEAAPAPAPAPRRATTRSASPSTHSASLEGRVYFLLRSEPEPRGAEFYGYLVIGPNVAADRKIAVMRGVGCRLDVAPTREAAEAIDKLGLVTLPSLRPASGTTTNPLEMINNYDTVRAERWVEAAETASGERFDSSQVILFIGSKQPRAAQLDTRSLPDPRRDSSMVIADASALDARYLSRWTHEVVSGVKSGEVASRQDMQSLMEYHSWITTLGSPLAAVMKIAPASAATPPASCL